MPVLLHELAFVVEFGEPVQFLPQLLQSRKDPAMQALPLECPDEPLIAVLWLRPPPPQRRTSAGSLAAMAVVGGFRNVPDTADGVGTVWLLCGRRCGLAHFLDLRK